MILHRGIGSSRVDELAADVDAGARGHHVRDLDVRPRSAQTA